jgi:hypothetical protein
MELWMEDCELESFMSRLYVGMSRSCLYLCSLSMFLGNTIEYNTSLSLNSTWLKCIV